MKDETKIRDWRSTGRRKGRRSLYESQIDYRCVDCGKTTINPPMDAPSFFEEIWPDAKRVLKSPLQVDHEDKDVTNNDLSNLNWRCASHHKLHDLLTETGISTVEKKIIY